MIERKGFPSHPTGYGAEASIQKAMNLLALCPGQDPSSASQRPSDPSGPVFSSHCHQNRRPDPMVTAAKSCLSSWIGIPHASATLKEEWWSLSGSNRRPPACKAGALPAELKPLFGARSPAPQGNHRSCCLNMVGPGRFELPTSPLSGVRSNQLSYGPDRPTSIGRGPAEGRRHIQ